MIPTTKEQVWQALRIASESLTIHELAMIINASEPSIKVHLYGFIDLGLLKVGNSKPRQMKGRRPLTYWLIDKNPVYPPSVKKNECK